MPGFIVNGVEDGQQIGGRDQDFAGRSNDNFIYNYTWKIFSLLGTHMDGKPPSAVEGDPSYTGSNALVYAKELTLPTFTVGVERHQGASLEYKFAKNVSWDDIKITFYDTDNMLAILRNWRRTIWTRGQGLRQAEQYKKNSEIDILTPDFQISSTWRLFGSWPSVIRHGELTYTNSDVKIVEITLTYDFAEELIGGASVNPNSTRGDGTPGRR